ncbi:MAG: type II toxin-antitoxin system ParD family antitoxin [Bacteroidota bacterium]
MTDLLKTAVYRLEELPAEEQDRQAAAILDWVERYQALRGALAEGLRDIDAGRVVPFDAEDIIRRGEIQRASLRG